MIRIPVTDVRFRTKKEPETRRCGDFRLFPPTYLTSLVEISIPDTVFRYGASLSVRLYSVAPFTIVYTGVKPQVQTLHKRSATAD